MGGILYTIAAVLVAIFIVTLVLHVASGLIYLLLVAAGVIFVFQLITGRRRL